ncbi:PREDICTED: ragulator complex protein LAMTOR5-like [Nicrophorus vespilloides]|uniref:Late endosomal/lysosomal adaptor and MAPK and MTOR activator 5 n=1 Tax=Nicrophorus vespilloides TaxID=110193 RepID=A0ABM1MPF1_NICVS|nr:PREDICTED: ragulator complex protein LAMTOR5-like [Nicrophorus vespilloides]
MEKPLERVMEEILNTTDVFGCVFADHQGLCLGVKGRASTESAGVIGAIAEEASKLEPNSRPPVIVLESENKMCIIQRNGTITGAIYKLI